MAEVTNETLLAWADRAANAATWTSGPRKRELLDFAEDILAAGGLSPEPASAANVLTIETDDIVVAPPDDPSVETEQAPAETPEQDPPTPETSP